ncbi:MAG TPA: DNA-formamidopyrimidine glycosylase family protein [Solirubrobacteraceae bacterium]|jgi:endonuclease-8|nr:DNA-formamidopyrimidine glycosylase family protein [Solirubrobacteraceae bacterium]
MPEGDTILWAATRMRPVLQGQVPDEVRMPAGRPGALRGSPGRDHWPQRLQGRRVERIDTHGKNLFLVFEGDLVLHSHLKMTGAWGVYPPGRRWHRSASRAWIVLTREGTEVVQFDGPVLELMTSGRSRFDQRLGGLGPDVLAVEFDAGRFLGQLRQDDPTRPIGDALLDQRNVAGIGNIWKSEGCWEAEVDPWRPVSSVSDEAAMRIIELARPRMLLSGTRGPRFIRPRIYRLVGQPCPRCGTAIRSRVQGEGGRMTYWCPGCQH